MANRIAEKNPGKLLYLYGITEKPAKLGALEGVDGRSQVEAVSCADFVCWISRVDPKEYGADLQAHMENLDWLAAASVRHQKVVGAIHEKVTILPARFATVFLSESSLASHVKKQSAALKKDFKRLSGADEYGVKIFGIPQVTGSVEAPQSGRDYLQRKSEMLRERLPVGATPEMAKFVAKLRDLAAEAAEGGNVTSGQRHLVWQGSFLLRRERRKQLESALAAFHRQSSERFRIECTGPWPPYSFIALKANGKGK